MSSLDEHKKNYAEKGTLLLSYDNLDFPLTKENIEELEKFCQEVDKEYITIGDAGEKNNLLVGRFMTDIEKPKVVQNPYSKNVISILTEKKLMLFLKKILKASNSSKTPKMLLFIKGFGESIDRSTCVSAAKLNIQQGLNFLKIPKSCFLLLISHFINV